MSVQSKTSSTSRRSSSRITNPNRCAFTTSDHRRCNMLRHASHSTLCLFHAREERRILEAERVGSELTTRSGEFRTYADVNYALGKLWEMLAHDRIPRKRAATMAYVAALLLPTLEPVRLESSRLNGTDAWINILRKAFPMPEKRAEPLPASE